MSPEHQVLIGAAAIILAFTLAACAVAIHLANRVDRRADEFGERSSSIKGKSRG